MAPAPALFRVRVLRRYLSRLWVEHNGCKFATEVVPPRENSVMWSA